MKKLEAPSFCPTELVKVLNEVKDFCALIVEQLGNLKLELKMNKAVVNRTIFTSGRSNLEETSISGKSVSDQNVIKKSEEFNVIPADLEKCEEMKENIENKEKLKIKKSKESKKKNRSEQDKSGSKERMECGNNVDLKTDSEISGTSQKLELKGDNSSVKIEKLNDIDDTEGIQQVDSELSDKTNRSYGFNVKVKSSIDVNNMLDSNKKIREKICSLEEIDDDETDVEIDINKSDISSDYFSALSSQALQNSINTAVTVSSHVSQTTISTAVPFSSETSPTSINTAVLVSRETSQTSINTAVPISSETSRTSINTAVPVSSETSQTSINTAVPVSSETSPTSINTAVLVSRETSQTSINTAVPISSETSRTSINTAVPISSETSRTSINTAVPLSNETSQTSINTAVPVSSETSQISINTAVPVSRETSQTSINTAVLLSRETSQTSINTAVPISSETSRTSINTAVPVSSETSRTSINTAVPLSNETSQTSINTAVPVSSETSQISINTAVPVSRETSQTSINTAVPLSSETSRTSINTAVPLSNETSQTSINTAVLVSSEASQTSINTAVPLSNEISQTSINNDVLHSSQNSVAESAKVLNAEKAGLSSTAEVTPNSTTNPTLLSQCGLTSSYPALYEAVVQQLKQVYPYLNSNQDLLNTIAAQQTTVLQMYMRKSGGSGLTNPMQPFGMTGASMPNQMSDISNPLKNRVNTDANLLQQREKCVNNPSKTLNSTGTNAVNVPSENDQSKMTRVKPCVGQDFLENLPDISNFDNISVECWNMNNCNSLMERMDTYLSVNEDIEETKVIKTSSSPIINDSTTPLKPPGFEKQNDFSVDIGTEKILSSSRSSTFVSSKSLNKWSESRDVSSVGHTTEVRTRHPPVKNVEKEISPQKPLDVPMSGFTFTKTLTQVKSVGPWDNPDGKKQSLPLACDKLPSLLSLPIPEKFRKLAPLNTRKNAESFHGSFSGFDSTCPKPNESEKKWEFKSSKSPTYDGPSNIPPRLQKKMRSSMNAPSPRLPLLKEPSWDDDVDDYAKPFVLNHDVRKPLDTNMNNSGKFVLMYSKYKVI